MNSATDALPIRREPFLKRPADILLALIGLVFAVLLWPVIGAWIKLADGGPVLFRQQRWGRGGSTFEVLKFRTMSVAAEPATSPSVVKDVRVTAPGRVLRAMGLDEIPQVVNILRGDMSLVGPRALAVGELVAIDGRLVPYEEVPGFAERLSVRPGLTGVATIYLPKDATPLEKFEADLRYVESQTFWLDIKLILLSIWISLRGRWESRDPKF